MTTPIIQAEGALGAVTTGDLSITLPSYQANDIVILNTIAWVPNTTTGQAAQTLSSPWTKISDYIFPDLATLDGELGLWWARATSNASLGTTITITRPTGWDTGADTCWAGRAYVIRGCITTGQPYDDIIFGVGAFFGGVLVSGGDRLVVQFFASTDNNSAGAAPTGYTAGTADTTNTGTDAGFQTFYISGASSTISEIASNTTAPAQGSSIVSGMAFRPPNPRYVIIT